MHINRLSYEARPLDTPSSSPECNLIRAISDMRPPKQLSLSAVISDRFSAHRRAAEIRVWLGMSTILGVASQRYASLSLCLDREYINPASTLTLSPMRLTALRKRPCRREN